MTPLPGVPNSSGEVYRLKKALYSLKQAPRAWFEKKITCDIVSWISFQLPRFGSLYNSTLSGCTLLPVNVDDMTIIADDIDGS